MQEVGIAAYFYFQKDDLRIVEWDQLQAPPPCPT